MKIVLTSCLLLATACGGPPRTSYARYPGAPPAFDPAQSDPKAVELADKVFTTAGGPGHWDAAKQIKWTQAVLKDGQLATEGEEAWDRWNGRSYGRLHQEGEDTIVVHEIYGEFGSAWSETPQGVHEQFEPPQRASAVDVARDAWKRDSVLMCLPFVLHEPGAKLRYVGPIHDNDKDYEEIELTFAPADTSRTGYTFTAFVDPATNLIARAEISNTKTNARAGYLLRDWTTAGGLQFAGTRENIGDKHEVIKLKNITVGAPDDTLYVPPVT